MDQDIAYFWFRRDLRLHDNAGLFTALKKYSAVQPIFIFDSEILAKLSSRRDPRVLFIYREISELKRSLEQKGSTLRIFFGKPKEVFSMLLQEDPKPLAVIANTDYEPYSVERDAQVAALMKGAGVEFETVKDHIIFEPNEVLKDDGTPYTVYTPYSKKWKSILSGRDIESYPSELFLNNLVKAAQSPMPSLEDMGFEDFSFNFPPKSVSSDTLNQYAEVRDFPAVNGTSQLGLHLRFGTVSIRELTRQAITHSATFLGELIWRNFFIQIMAHFPYAADGPFKKQYANIAWRNNEQEFEKWCHGETGYPIVDAGMRELLHTGFMHNRVRMITASFLTKHLLIDWRWGEAWFAEKLLDFELASNNGNWQWAAGTGCDAAPYFRVFNPTIQEQKFDPQGKYIARWVPEAGTIAYARAIVEHSMARDRAINAYKSSLAKG